MGRRIAAAALAVVLCSRAFSADREDGRLPVDRVLAEEVMQVCRDEGSRAQISAWIWGLTGTALATYAVVAFSGGHGRDSGLKYFAAIGALGSAGGSMNAVSRRGDMRRLRVLLAQDVGATDPSTALSPGTVREVGGELRRRHASLISASAGSIRAGCILPVLLSGMSVFGYSMGNPAGADLAGICMAGAFGIGGPSMIYYLNIKRDLDRMDALMPRWNESFREKKKEGL